VVEGDASIVRDDAMLARVADAYASIYGWQVTVRQGAFHDAGGAPIAGPPPYDAYEVTPTVVFGLPIDETPLEREVLEYAEAMTNTPPTLTDEPSASLLERLGPAATVTSTSGD
jgi:hypothetical protein